MELRFAFRFVLFILYLYGTNVESASYLPQLPRNRLSEGADRDLPNAVVMECGQIQVITSQAGVTRTPSQALSSNVFGREAFTAGAIGSHQSPRISGIEGRFSFVQVRGKLNALQVDGSGESAYWLPQGGSIDIPRIPDLHQPKYVFTPDFSGCSWTVTPLSNGNLRVRHVQGNHEADEFNNLTPAQKGGDTTYAMQYMDYGYVVEMRRLVGNVPAFAYMHYSGGHWTLNFQRQTCAPSPAGYTFKNNRLSAIKVVEKRSSYPTISGTKSYIIP